MGAPDFKGQKMKFPDDFIGKIIQGDCLKVMKQMPDKCVDLVLTDPPYNVGLNYSNGDNRPDYKIWCESWFLELTRISNCVLFTPGIVNLKMWESIEDFKHFYWIKPNQNSPSRLGGFSCVEPLLCIGKHKRIGQDFFIMNIGQQPDIGNHPCPKYLPAWEKIIQLFTEDNALILDCFLCSGTTAVAAERLSRRWIGIEMEQKYCAIAQARVDAERNQLKLPGML